MAAAVLFAVLIVTVALIRQVRLRRRHWLRALGLSGGWECVADGRVLHLDLRGGPGSGDYEERIADGGRLLEQGVWEVRGYNICFLPVDAQPVTCELRAFNDGSIGIHGAGRSRRVYQRRTSNVIQMRSRR